jgi:Fic family protein
MPIRVFDIAKKLGVDNKTVLSKAKELGIRAAKNPSSSIDKITGEWLEESLVADIAKFREVKLKPDLETASPQLDYEWKPIEDLPTNRADLSSSQIIALVKAWQDQAEELKQKQSYQTFLMQLRRQWAIETGILERLYTISDGATKTLIEKGLDAAFISHEDTNKPPGEVLNIIRDQHQAIDGLYDFISGNRPLGTSYVKELHSVLTAHQRTYEAVDTLGKRVTPLLPRGEWKSLPNSLDSKDSVRFCPPIHVDSEMERLLKLHAEHEAAGVPPNVEAAWLHHRFTLIHPFTDGNGRMARCLATLVFLKANWFPLVVTRNDREPYIAALRHADKGNLKPLVELFDNIQSKAIRQAFSLSEETIQETVAMQGILKAAKEKFQKLREEQEALKKQVLKIADTLQAEAFQRLKEVAQEVSTTIKSEGVSFRARAAGAAYGDEKDDYHNFQIIQYAKASNYFANRSIYRAWATLTIHTKIRTEILFAFHGIGNSTGVLVCSAMAYNREMNKDGTDSVIGTIEPLSDGPFSFTYTENPSEVARRFRRWLEHSLVQGLNYWQKNISV